jgi:hypothetical protein
VVGMKIFEDGWFFPFLIMGYTYMIVSGIAYVLDLRFDTPQIQYFLMLLSTYHFITYRFSIDAMFETKSITGDEVAPFFLRLLFTIVIVTILRYLLSYFAGIDFETTPVDIVLYLFGCYVYTEGIEHFVNR